MAKIFPGDVTAAKIFDETSVSLERIPKEAPLDITFENLHYSIYASKRIAGVAFDAVSDARIKDIQGVSDGVADLNTLMEIEITDYQLKDKANHGNHKYKKVIGQQIDGVYPQAVNKLTKEVVPDIYQLAAV